MGRLQDSLDRSSATRARKPLRERIADNELLAKDPWDQFSLDSTKRMAVIDWPQSADATSVTVIGYYSDVPTALAARDANAGDGATPALLFNTKHSDFVKSQEIGQTVGPEWYQPRHADVWWRNASG